MTGARDVVSGYEGERERADGPLRLVTHGGGAYLEWTEELALVVRSVTDGSEIAALQLDTDALASAVLSPHGKVAAAAYRDKQGTATIATWVVGSAAPTVVAAVTKGDGVLAVADDGTVAANRPNNDVFVVRPPDTDPRVLTNLANWRLTLSTDGSRLAISGNGGELRVLDTRTRRGRVGVRRPSRTADRGDAR